MNTHEELHRIVRQLKSELEWAFRTGIEDVPRVLEPAPSSGDTHGLDGLDGGARSEAGREGSFVDPQDDALELERSDEISPAVVAPPEGLFAQLPQPQLPVLKELAGCSTLENVRGVLGDCTRCKLHKLGRKQIVFGVGNPHAELMFVGEGPGADEDRQGEPFVGAAGQLLTKIIESGMGIARKDVYIANIVKCRPPKNRDPDPDEIEQCQPFLLAQIRAIKPKVMVALGRIAAQTLLRSTTPITRLRGQWHEYDGIPLMPTYHPAFLLRNPAEKRAVWSDVQEVMHKLGRSIPVRGS